MSAPSSMFSAALIVPAMRDAVRKLDPRQLIRNPVMFVTAIVATLLSVLLVIGEPGLSIAFEIQLVIWLWLTVLFGTFAEALAEGRGRAQAASLRATKAELKAKLMLGVGDTYEIVHASQLRPVWKKLRTNQIVDTTRTNTAICSQRCSGRNSSTVRACIIASSNPA